MFGRIAIGSPSRSKNVPLLVFSYFTWQGIFVIWYLLFRVGDFGLWQSKVPDFIGAAEIDLGSADIIIRAAAVPGGNGLLIR